MRCLSPSAVLTRFERKSEEGRAEACQSEHSARTVGGLNLMLRSCTLIAAGTVLGLDRKSVV
jgi:hypothetical protein